MRANWGRGRRSWQSYLPSGLGGIPVVAGVLLASVGVFLLYFLVYAWRAPIIEWLAFTADPRSLEWLTQPWKWITYVFLQLDFLGLLFGGYLLYLAGGTLERSWGSVNFAVLFGAFCVIAALGFVAAAYLFGQTFILAGYLIPVAALWAAWAALDPELEFRLYGVLPLRLKWIALITVGFIYFSYGLSTGPMGPIVGLFALAAPAAAFFYVRKLPRLSLGGFRRPADRWAPDLREDVPRRRREEPRERVGGLNPLRRRQEQQEIERLRKLLGEDDDDRPLRH